MNTRRVFIILLVLAILIGAALYGIFYEKKFAPAQQTSIPTSYALQKQQITEKILSHTYAYGFVKEIKTNGLVFIVHGIVPPSPELFAVITPGTKFYKKKNSSENETKVEILQTDIKVGDAIMVVTGEVIGNHTNIDALEITKFQ